MSWFGTTALTEKVYHPDGNFDISALIDQISDIESRGYKPSVIVMTSEQERECLRVEENKMLGVGVYYGKQSKIFGLDIEINNVPEWCVAIDNEFGQFYKL